jgi:putative molybdopterin biosynthesis protein
VKSVHDHHLDPRSAYAQWADACARAGWRGTAGARDAERVPLAGALGRVSAEPVVARCPSPLADCAAMDGIAVASGTPVPNVPAGSFAWIDTGDPLPPWADAVVMREHVRAGAGGAVAIDPGAAPRPGQHVRRQGEDFPAGQVLVPAGRRLRPADLAAAAAGGHGTLAVARKPVVAIIPTGDEIVPAGTPVSDLRPGDIIDSNSVYLTARCARAGATAAVTGVVPDDPDALAAAFRDAAAGSDLVLVIAGSSRGRGDHTAAVLAQVGGVAVAGIAIRPGHPALLGYAKAPSGGTVPVAGLPGYPVAAAVVFELFAAPLLALIQGEDPSPAVRPARLAVPWTSPAGVEEWVPVSVAPDGTATPAGEGSGSTSRLARADAWWPVPAAAGHVSEGTPITVISWP